MTEDELAAHPATRALRAVVIDLTLVSHVQGASYDSSPGKRSRDGGRRPPGGADGRGDREEGYRQKTAIHFVRRFDRLARRAERGRATEGELRLILEDARRALLDWRKAPRVEKPRPQDLTPWDKSQIAADPRSARTVAADWGISHVSVIRYRRSHSNAVRLRREEDTR